MTNALFRYVLPAALAVIVGAALPALAMDGHRIVAADQVEWGAGPASLDEGAEAAVLYGNPGADGLFALRLKLPADFHIAPHTHPRPEVVTVVSGTFRLGMGDDADREAAEVLPAGSFFALEPGMVHYAYADEETVVQINSTGPWSIEYVHEKDDPRLR